MNTGEFRRLCRRFFSVILAALLVTGAGCRMTTPKHQSGAPKRTQTAVAANPNQVRLQMRALVQPMCGELEQAADGIIAGTTNRAVQQAALRWKIEGVPAVREALFQPDPFTAVIDTWVLFNQMAEYFDKGKGKELLGEASALAADTCRSMEDEFARIVAAGTASGDSSKPRAFARKWAAEHPIQYSISGRESPLSGDLEQNFAGSFSFGEVVAEVTTTVDDLNRKIAIYSDQLFRQARWEAELFKENLMAELPIAQTLPLAERAVKSSESAIATVDRLAPVIEHAVGVAEGAPKLITAEREAAIKSLQDELTRTIEFAQQQRVTALRELHEAMVTERLALTQDMEQISLKMVDHAFWRTAQFLAGGFVVLAIVLFVVVMFFKRSRIRNP